MNKIIRLYNQNRFKVWIGIAVIIFILAIIQVLNNNAKQTDNSQNTAQNDISTEKYEDESISLVSGDEVPEEYSSDFGNLIDSFLTYCKENNVDEAYKLLSSDCKRLLYPTKEIFEENYCKGKFKNEKWDYSFQSWTTKNAYIYRIKFFEDMLSTGIANKTYIEDYYSIIKEENTYKLGINGYVGRVNYNNSAEQENIKITVDSADIFMDYSIYNISVENNTERDILLDDRKNTDSTYISNDNGTEFEAFIHEYSDEDLCVKSKETKNLSIKFSSIYTEGLPNKKLTFSSIVTDYEKYLNNNDVQYYVKIEVEL